MPWSLRDAAEMTPRTSSFGSHATSEGRLSSVSSPDYRRAATLGDVFFDAKDINHDESIKHFNAGPFVRLHREVTNPLLLRFRQPSIERHFILEYAMLNRWIVMSGFAIHLVIRLGMIPLAALYNGQRKSIVSRNSTIAPLFQWVEDWEGVLFVTYDTIGIATLIFCGIVGHALLIRSKSPRVRAWSGSVVFLVYCKCVCVRACVCACVRPKPL